MDHPSVDELRAFAVDAFWLRIRKKRKFLAIERHVNRCEECKVFVGLLQSAKERRREKALAELSQAVESGEIVIPERYDDGKECPDEETIVDYAGDSLSAMIREKVDEHIRMCRYCDIAIQDARKHLPDDMPSKRSDRTNLTWTTTAREFLGATPARKIVSGAALAGIAILVGLWVLPDSILKERSSSDERGSESKNVIEIVGTFHWKSFKNATSYKVVFEETRDLDFFQSVETRDTMLTDIETAFLQEGRTYTWYVQAFIGSRNLGESESQTLER